ncbi:MAG TPA: PhzF family phenazine biosynthesis protein [Rhizomicrobium sp.]|nr:PhzF family phenazine biosynthesis protein [Rhizomicrobium sp.]
MRLWAVDSFADRPFRGNPACVLEPFAAWPDSAWLQTLAAELRREATAFLLYTGEPARFGLRWFSPTRELPLCGHGTLAAAHVLASEFGYQAVIFETASAVLHATKSHDVYALRFPASPPSQIDIPSGLADALGVEPTEVWSGRYLIAVLGNEQDVRALRPDIAALKSISLRVTGGSGNVGVAALADPGHPYDVVDRFFAPGSGIDEDPATGSLHCMLAPLFSGRLGRARLRYHQAFPGRGGDIECEHRGEQVLLRGNAVTVYSGELSPEIGDSIRNRARAGAAETRRPAGQAKGP